MPRCARKATGSNGSRKDGSGIARGINRAVLQTLPQFLYFRFGQGWPGRILGTACLGLGLPSLLLGDVLFSGHERRLLV